MMRTTSRWILPCSFTDNKYSTAPIEFDLTTDLKNVLSNEVWERKFQYVNVGLKNTDKNSIRKASVIIYPRFIQGQVNEIRIPEIIEKHCGNIPEYLNVSNYQNWSHFLGVAIIEIEYSYSLDNIPVKIDFIGYHPNWDENFITTYHQQFAVLKELKFLFLAGLHLTFPTINTTISDDNPIFDGFFHVKSKRRKYATNKPSSSFMHQVLIEKDKINILKDNIEGLAEVWHYNLWPVYRYLKAVETDQISMDNLLDLIYSLEGLFKKNTSSDIVKIMCAVNLSNNKKDARDLKQFLDSVFRVRNDIAHGERSYALFDKVKVNGKEVFAQDLYWKTKTIVAQMIILATRKLLKDKNIKNLKFNEDDFLSLIYN